MKRLCDFSSRFRILKGGKISLVVSALLGTTTLSFAAPSGGVVTSGSANISSSGNTTNIIQNTNKVTINWDKFNIAKDEIVNFKQPNINSIALNRVIGNEKSIINGALNANGQVWILNSNGVLFGKNAKINTAGLLATTKNLSDNDFNSGNYNFKGSSTESVINLGEIDISDSGYATLLANRVSNEGTIKAVKGSVRLVGADEVSINLNGNSIVDLTVNKGVLDSLVENKGAIYADGGEIYLTTNAVDELLKGVVNNEGIIEANSLDGVTGFVELFAHGGEAKIGGTIRAKDGFVETSGKTLSVKNSASIKAAKWLLDPIDVIIDDGTGAVGEATVGVSVIENALNSGDVTVEADNDITINSNLTNSGTGNTLILTADVDNSGDGDINVNAVVTVGAGDGITLNYGANGNLITQRDDSTDTFTGKINLDSTSVVTINGNVYTVVNTITDLQDINGNVSGNYVLGADIDASSTSSWNVGDHDGDSNTAEEAMGFNPIGSSNMFNGSFDGLGHTIDNLYINRQTSSKIGLFGNVGYATLKNIGLTNVNIKGASEVGSLVGYAYINTLINNAFSTGDVVSVNNYSRVGGLIGQLYGGTVSNSYSNSTVQGKVEVGGLVGRVSSNSRVLDSYSSSTVQGTEEVGGLVGVIYGGTISNSYSNSTVQGEKNVGGLLGYYYSGRILDSYSLSNISAQKYFGGLIGYFSDADDIIQNSFYDVSITQINGKTGVVTPFALYNTQFQDWLNNDKSLDISKYFTLNNDIYEISDLNDLKNILGFAHLEGNSFKLINNIDLASAEGFYIPFLNSNFDGNNHTISNLKINLNNLWIGFIGWSDNVIIENIGLENVDITGHWSIGGLAGVSFNSTIKNSYSTGSIAGTGQIGGLLGFNSQTNILNSYSTANVLGNGRVGGLVGSIFSGASIDNSYAKGKISGESTIGGIVGYIDNTNNTYINNAYYDKTVNQGMEHEDFYGKTTAELQNINTFKDGSKYEWSIVEDSTLEKGTPILAWQVDKAGDMNPIWLIGTKVTSKPIIDKPEVETETPNKEIDKVITTIVNKEAVKVPTAPKVTTTPNNSGKNVNVSFSVGENKQIVSKPIEGQATKRVTLSEAKQMQQEVTGETVGDVKVPLSRSSQIVLVNGGVSLPTGVEQEFYVADDEI